MSDTTTPGHCCSVEGCDKTAARKGYCGQHYARQWRHGTVALVGPQPRPCGRCGTLFQPPYNRNVYCSDECRRGRASCLRCGISFLVKAGSKGQYCSTACWYETDRGGAKSCPVCGSPYKGQGLTCSKSCGGELRRRSNPKRKTSCEHCGTDILAKKPGIRFCSRSCAMLARPGGGRALRHPDGTRRLVSTGYVNIKVDGRWMLEHRHVVEQQIGRPLLAHERVHHKNGVRDDNRPENLELWRIKGKDPAGVRASDYHCPGCRCSEPRST